MYIPATHSLSPLELAKSLSNRLIRRSEDRIYFSYARYAIKALVHGLARKGIKELLAPAYICREALEGLGESPVQIQFYDLLPDMSPDFERLSLVPAGLASLLLVHYFGFPNAVEKALQFCREKSFILIEDCAQALSSCQKGKPLGNFGDAAIVSPRKFVPVPHGAYVVIHNHELRGDLQIPEAFSPILVSGIGRDLVRWVILKSKFNVGRFNTSPDLHPEDQLGAPLNSKTGMSMWAGYMLQWFEGQSQVVEKRIRNYELLLGELGALPMNPIFPNLPPDVCPFAFPLSVPRRDEMLMRLRKLGIGAQFWPTLPSGILNNPEFPQTNRFRRELLLLPIHQDLTETHMKYMLACLSKIL